MTDTEALARADARVALLEEALAEYAARYGLTERARALFRKGSEEILLTPSTRPDNRNRLKASARPG